MRARRYCSPRNRTDASGRRWKTHDGRVITQAAQRDVGDGRRAGIHARRRVGLDLRRQSNTSNAECVGWHVCKVGSHRSRALDSDCARSSNGSIGSLDARRRPRAGASPMDPIVSQYLSDHFLKQIRYWGILPQLRLCRGTGQRTGWRSGWAIGFRSSEQADPRPNLSEPRGRPRRLVADFVAAGTDQTWRLEKLGYQTPNSRRRPPPPAMSYARRHSTNELCPQGTGCGTPPNRAQGHGC